jgi:carboxylesterase
MHSRDDDFVPPVNTANIYDHLGSADKELVWVEKSDHVITEDGDRERVFRAAWDFIKRVSETA